MAPIVPADLRNRDSDGRIRLNTAVTLAELARQGLELDVGLALVVYCGGSAEPGQSLAATVEYSAAEGIWVAAPDDLGDSNPAAFADRFLPAQI